ncbi:hypothetical protein D9M73_226100 [compost metagenome]
MLAAEVLAPIDVHIGFGTGDRANQDEFFLQQLLNLQAWPISRLEHQCRIKHAQLQLP